MAFIILLTEYGDEELLIRLDFQRHGKPENYQGILKNQEVLQCEK